MGAMAMAHQANPMPQVNIPKINHSAGTPLQADGLTTQDRAREKLIVDSRIASWDPMDSGLVSGGLNVVVADQKGEVRSLSKEKRRDLTVGNLSLKVTSDQASYKLLKKFIKKGSNIQGVIDSCVAPKSFEVRL